jgi:bla regulator protein blaR1
MRRAVSLVPALGSAKFRGVTIEVLARFLAPPVHRPVFDRTGLTGYFDADLEATAEFGPPPPPPGLSDRIDRATLPSIFSVLQDRMGLKLDAQRGPVKVYVIDRLEHSADR